MQTHQERLFAASQLVIGVANFLVEYVDCQERLEAFALIDVISRLDLAYDAIRSANGCDA